MKLADAVRQVPITRIIGPGDVPERQKTDEVIQLAASCKALGGRPLHPLCCISTKKGWRIVSGRNRFAAGLLAKFKTLPVQEVLEANDVELLWIEIHENLHRRHDDKAALTKRLVDQAEGVIIKSRGENLGHMSQVADAEHPKKPGPEKSTRQQARELVASASGDDVATVKKNDQRASAKIERHDDIAAEEPAAPKKAEPGIDLHGHDLPPQMADVAGLVRQYGAIVKALGEAKQRATDLDLFASSVKGSTAEIVHAIERVIALVRAETPTDLCPKCKGVAGVRCGLCFESGWVKRDKYNSAPAEQRVGMNQLNRAMKPKKSRGGVDIVNEDGSTTRVT